MNQQPITKTTIRKLTIATRKSPLALWQAEYIKYQLELLYPEIRVELLKIVTKGDKILDTPLAKIGGKGLFVKELEQAIYDKRADIAVHSLKDVPMVLPDGLVLGAYCKRAEPTDAFVSNDYDSLEKLPQGAVVGTASLRRQCQLKNYRTDLQIKSLRGNVGSRLGKLDNGDYDAIILATSGLKRIGLDERIKEELDTTISLPAVGQGALAIECRADDKEVLELLEPLNDNDDRLCLLAERALNRYLQGGCQVPIACFALLTNKQLTNKQLDNSQLNNQQSELWLRGRVGSEDGSVLLKSEQKIMVSGEQKDKETQAEQLGIEVAKQLLAQGAGDILKAVYSQNSVS